MRATLIPLPLFLDAAFLASRKLSDSLEGTGAPGAKQYVGIVVILDRKAEQRSRLLDDLVREGSSINDITRQDLLVALPGREEAWPPAFQTWVIDPEKDWDGVRTPGLFLAGTEDRAWSHQLWELVSDQVERLQSPEDQDRIAHALDQSASSVCDYLGLSEADIPCLVVFSLQDHQAFVFRYGGDADDSPYRLFKNIAVRRPRNPRSRWLTDAIQSLARDWGLHEGEKPVLAPPSLSDWEATCYLPYSEDSIPLESARD